MQMEMISREPLLANDATAKLKRIGTSLLYLAALALITIFSSLLIYVIISVNPINLPMSATNSFWGISYNPARVDQWCPELEDVTADLLMISRITHRVRTYGDSCHLDMILSAIEKNPKQLGHFRVTAGIPLKDTNDANQGAIKEILQVIREHGSRHIDMISVGNEVILKHLLPVDTLIQLIEEVRRQVGRMFFQRIPVTTVDVFKTFDDNPKLVKAVDCVVANLHPYFVDDITASQAAEVTFKQLNELQDSSQGKEVIIGETGWPSAGGGSRTTIDNYNIYMKDFLCKAAQRNVKFFWFEAFDAKWKTDQSEIEQNWGIFTADRSNKTGLDLPPFRRCEKQTS
uniref:glucan endo-1,3-beta-D-glucosidase n=1 Tax=Spongospora subterranea TaxID=70186 RepID=A0A0H5R5X3_9EUKA|eukprot:CRZ09256.1 hypothetical protein [Spongospora subterranea]